MKIKLIFIPGIKLVIQQEWIFGIPLAEELTSFVNHMKERESFNFSLHNFSSLYWIVRDFFENYNALTRFFEVEKNWLNMLDRIIMELKKRPKTAEEMEKYREALKKTIIIYRTAADDVMTDNISVQKRQLYNETYALLAKTYLAEYLGREVRTLTDIESYPEYAKLYDWAYEEHSGVYKAYAIPYRAGRARADSLTSTEDSSRDTAELGAGGEAEPLLTIGMHRRHPVCETDPGNPPAASVKP